MLKANTGRTREPRARRQKRNVLVRVAKRDARRSLPRWVPVAASLTLVFLIAITMNVRAYFEFRDEQLQNADLSQQAQQLTNENIGIQEQIYYLKNDTDTIEREAKKYGLVRPRQEEKVSQAGDIDKAEKSTNRQSPTR